AVCRPGAGGVALVAPRPLRAAPRRLQAKRCRRIGAAAPLGVGALRLHARGAVGVVDLLELHRAGEGERHRPEPHPDVALVGALVDHLGELRARHARCDALDVHQHRPRLGRRQRHLEGVVEFHGSTPKIRRLGRASARPNASRMPAFVGSRKGSTQPTDHMPAFASAISSRIRCGVSGVCVMRTPNGASASSIAEITAAAAGIVPTSPAPLAPSGLSGDGVCLNSVSIAGTSTAPGSRYSAKLVVSGWPPASYPIHSSSALPMPCATPPSTWPVTIIGLIRVPESWIAQ